MIWCSMDKTQSHIYYNYKCTNVVTYECKLIYLPLDLQPTLIISILLDFGIRSLWFNSNENKINFVIYHVFNDVDSQI